MSRVTYQEAETYISELPKFTKKNTLEHTQKFLSFLGNPQNGKKVIHVAGTNGKGSVCVYLDAMLRAQGKHTGLFTSPHLIRMNERIRMDGELVSDETFTRLFLRTQQSVRRKCHIRRSSASSLTDSLRSDVRLRRAVSAHSKAVIRLSTESGDKAGKNM